MSDMPIAYSDDETMVLEFLDHWEGGNIDVLLGYFAEGASYIDMPLPPRHGKDQIRMYLDNVFSAFAVRIETLNIASRDSVIFTERVDYLQSNADPSVVVPLPVTGVMEVRDGKIVAWRDYLDLRTAEEGLGITIRPIQNA
ncbi:SnoaL-like domain-containing protein [Sphingobium sp. AR-3-1]|uniref:SnoaL-like domain-containing protein n=1 Tax=Sphingobium psychrophilum TaxID=2728834 RepID=A0A7X9WY56_9SPHN|nr:limonene-1,2-epoxide hydrolase family protein [Sphingobium psychrophilum]NML12029.1 SnoaL-like domain-containing protein [Sphingobium psychrophilum]